jgi:hypothetical protein
MPSEICLECPVESAAWDKGDSAKNLDGWDFGKTLPHPADHSAASASNIGIIARFT